MKSRQVPAAADMSLQYCRVPIAGMDKSIDYWSRLLTRFLRALILGVIANILIGNFVHTATVRNVATTSDRIVEANLAYKRS